MKTNLKTLRKATGMTANEFAESVGVNRYTYRNWEQGVNDYDIVQAVKLAEIFGVTLDDLIRADRVEYELIDLVTGEPVANGDDDDA